MSFEKNIRTVVPYTPGEQPQRRVIKLNTNESPYAPSPKVAEVLHSFDADSLRRYPQPDCHVLTEALAAYHHVEEDQVFVGVGSDDVLSMCFLTFFAGEKPILFPDITYSFYEVWAAVYRIPFIKVPLTDQFELRPEDYRRENGGIIFANPNAPTGKAMSLTGVEQIIKENPDSVVIVDEAYVDFGGESALPLISRYDNLLVTRTMSKARALAGMRIGYALGSKKLIRYLNDVKFSVNSYTMNAPSLAVGVASLEDARYFRETTAKMIATREWTKEQLRELGFTFADSKSNFIFATHKSVPARDIFLALKENNIYVRYWSKPRIDNYLRITIGTKEQMQKLITFLKTYLKEH